jgi:putative endonuclease
MQFPPNSSLRAQRSNLPVDYEKGKMQAFVYIMTNDYNTVLYTGVTNDLIRRVTEHKKNLGKHFTGKYLANKLVYFEMGESITVAIEREKQIKGGSRQKKIDLINSLNPDWKDLYEEILGD